MTTDVFSGYVDDLRVLRAERLLDEANAANPPRAWVSRMVGIVTQAAHEAAMVAGNIFTINGVAVGVDGLKRWLGRTVGGRISDDGEVRTSAGDAARRNRRQAIRRDSAQRAVRERVRSRGRVRS